MEKRSITIAGHRTSIALEPEFWSALGEMALGRAIGVTTLITEIDRLRGGENLASACRLAVLRHYRQRRETSTIEPSASSAPSAARSAPLG